MFACEALRGRAHVAVVLRHTRPCESRWDISHREPTGLMLESATCVCPDFLVDACCANVLVPADL